MKSILSVVVEVVYWVTLSLWFGGIAVFSFLVAPVAFNVLPSAELAGNLVGAVLAKLYIAGTFAGILLLLTSNWLRSRGLMSRRQRLLLSLCLLVALAANVYAQWSIAPRVAELRSSGAIEKTQAADDQARGEFDKLHRRSVQLMMANLIALLAAIALSTRRTAANAAPASPTP